MQTVERIRERALVRPASITLYTDPRQVPDCDRHGGLLVETERNSGKATHRRIRMASPDHEMACNFQDRQMLCPMSMFALPPNLGGPDLIVLLLIRPRSFGAKKLPELVRGMGSAIKNQKAKDDH